MNATASDELPRQTPRAALFFGAINVALGILGLVFNLVNLVFSIARSVQYQEMGWVERAIESSPFARMWLVFLPLLRILLASLLIAAGVLLLRNRISGRRASLVWVAANLCVQFSNVAITFLAIVPQVRQLLQEAGHSGDNASAAGFGVLIWSVVMSIYPVILWAGMLGRPLKEWAGGEDLGDELEDAEPTSDTLDQPSQGSNPFSP